MPFSLAALLRSCASASTDELVDLPLRQGNDGEGTTQAATAEEDKLHDGAEDAVGGEVNSVRFVSNVGVVVCEPCGMHACRGGVGFAPATSRAR